MQYSTPTLSNPVYYSAPLLLAFVFSVVMLVTDKNLQTDFGTVSSGYYFHWYVVAVTAVADIIGAALLLLFRSRGIFKLNVIGSGLLVVVFLGAVLTYSQVGFSSASAFANYLFGVTYSGGDIRYLYDVLVALYLATFLWGVIGLATSRPAPSPPVPLEIMPPSTP